MTMPPALADAGLTPAEYDLIQQARWHIDEVNARLRAVGAPMQYAVTLCTTTPIRPSDPSALVLEAAQTAEQGPGQAAAGEPADQRSGAACGG